MTGPPSFREGLGVSVHAARGFERGRGVSRSGTAVKGRKFLGKLRCLSSDRNMPRLYLRCNESPGGRLLDEPIIANVRRRFAPRHIGRIIAGFALGWSLSALVILCSNEPWLGHGPNNALTAVGIVAFGAIASAITFAWWLSRRDRSKGWATRLTIQDDRLMFESGGSIARASVLSGAVADLDDQRASVAIQTKTERWLITVPKHAGRDIEATLALVRTTPLRIFQLPRARSFRVSRSPCCSCCLGSPCSAGRYGAPCAGSSFMLLERIG